MTSPGVRPTRAVASRLTAICSCGRPVSCSARRSATPSTPRIRRFCLLGETRQLVEIRAEDAHRQVGRRAAQSLVDAHAQRRREQHGDARQPSSRARMSASISSSARERSVLRTTSTSDTVCGIGSSVRSARPVRRTTSSTSGTSRSTSSTRWFSRSTSSSEASAGSTVCSRNAPSSSCGMKSLPMRRPRTTPARRSAASPAPPGPDAAGSGRAPARTTA